jgi:hypothetical protein
VQILSLKRIISGRLLGGSEDKAIRKPKTFMYDEA